MNYQILSEFLLAFSPALGLGLGFLLSQRKKKRIVECVFCGAKKGYLRFTLLNPETGYWIQRGFCKACKHIAFLREGWSWDGFKIQGLDDLIHASN